jgi:hypothetical protein
MDSNRGCCRLRNRGSPHLAAPVAVDHAGAGIDLGRC